MAKKPCTRITFDLSQTQYQALQQLKKDFDAKTAAEVFRRLLALFDHLWREKQNGFNVKTFDPSTGEERDIVFWL